MCSVETILQLIISTLPDHYTLFLLQNDLFTGMITWDAGRTLEKLINHLQTSLVFSQHPVWVITVGKPIESAAYCLSKL